ncbi:MFS allantoate transporter [Colletotrichum tofieldiae]|nr:MFS allantoate transporter [Colletotrichum tofieldiae]GKT68938.1 MFS allantoate transporter [Colletotrichum tofieldiae]
MSHANETKKMAVIEPRAGPDDAHSSDPKLDMMANAKDIGAAAYAEARNLDSDDLEGERRRVKRKMDRILMPMLLTSFVFQFLDKLSLNYAAAYTLIPDLGLEGQQYSTVASAFAYGNIIWYIPASMLLQRLPVAKYTGIMIGVWGALLMCCAAAKNFGGIFALRFILGMAESNMTPAYMMICSMFFTRQELSLRLVLFIAMNGLATAGGSLIAFGFGHVHSTSITSWQLIFLVIGGANLLWAVLFLYIVPDSPMNARWLNEREKLVAVDRVSQSMIGIKDKAFKWRQIQEAFLDPKVFILCICGFCNGVGSGGLGYFGSALLKGYGFSGINATLLQLPTGIIEFIVLPISGWVASRYINARCYVAVVTLSIPFAGFLGIRLTSLEHQWRLVGSTWILYVFAIGAAACYSLLAANFAGHTKRSFVNGLWFVVWACGNVAGTNFFKAEEAPRYFTGITALLSFTSGTMVMFFVFAFYCKWENKRRDRVYGVRDVDDGEADDEGIRAGFMDKTDIENKHFRYAY